MLSLSGIMKEQLHVAPLGWSPALWQRLNKFSEQISTPKLIVFFLAIIAETSSESHLRTWLKDIAQFSRDDIFGILDELDPAAVAVALDRQEK